MLDVRKKGDGTIGLLVQTDRTKNPQESRQGQQEFNWVLYIVERVRKGIHMTYTQRTEKQHKITKTK